MHPALAQLMIPAAALAAAAFALPAGAAGPGDAPLPVMVGGIAQQRVVLRRSGDGGGTAGACDPVVSTHTNASFEGGQYIAQRRPQGLQLFRRQFLLRVARQRAGTAQRAIGKQGAVGMKGDGHWDDCLAAAKKHHCGRLASLNGAT